MIAVALTGWREIKERQIYPQEGCLGFIFMVWPGHAPLSKFIG
jgi:hypothetical protein